MLKKIDIIKISGMIKFIIRLMGAASGSTPDGSPLAWWTRVTHWTPQGLIGLAPRDDLDMATTSHNNLMVRNTYDAIVRGVALFDVKIVRDP